MSETSAFRQLGTGATVRITFDGRALDVPADVSVAAALLVGGIARFRTTPVGGAPRAPYCMMGVCFECLVEIDREPGRQACMVPVREGMAIRTQSGASDLAATGGTDGG